MKFEHIGWMKEGNSDKVWGMILLQDSGSNWNNNKYVSFWGRRGAKLQTKIVECNRYEAQKMFEKKTDKGYQEVNKNRLDEVYPEFQSDLEKTAFWATFKI
jgi:predicted DNA-binding WGR domain protein